MSMTGFQHVCLLHDKAPANTSETVKQFLVGGDRLAIPTVLSRSSPFRLFPYSSYLVIDIAPGKSLA